MMMGYRDDGDSEMREIERRPDQARLAGYRTKKVFGRPSFEQKAVTGCRHTAIVGMVLSYLYSKSPPGDARSICCFGDCC